MNYIDDLKANLSADYVSLTRTSLGNIAGLIINLAFGIAISISIISILLSGIKFVTTTSGNPRELEVTRKSLTNSITALVLAVTAFLIMRVVASLVGVDDASTLLDKITEI